MTVDTGYAGNELDKKNFRGYNGKVIVAAMGMAELVDSPDLGSVATVEFL